MEQGFAYEKQPKKTKTLIEYSSILFLHYGFNKEKNKPINPTSVAMNNNIIATLDMKSEKNYHIIHIAETLKHLLWEQEIICKPSAKHWLAFCLILNQSNFISTSTFIKDDPALEIIQESFFITSSSYIDQTGITPIKHSLPPALKQSK